MAIVGGNLGLVGHEKRKIASASKDVTVNWTWYNENQGIVSWNFTNNSNEQKTVILYRSGYYFGNAFWCVYVNNGMTSWATAPLTPLIDQGIENNTMPIGIVDFQGSPIIAFLFTLAPNQKWSVLEGGFSALMPPTNPIVYDVTLVKSGQFCIGYDPQQVIDWDIQTQTTMQGYQPNPSTITTVEVEAPSDAEYVALFNDPISSGQCPPQPSCDQLLQNAIDKGNIDDFIEAIYCYLNQMGVDIKRFVEKIIKHFLDKI